MRTVSVPVCDVRPVMPATRAIAWAQALLQADGLEAGAQALAAALASHEGITRAWVGIAQEHRVRVLAASGGDLAQTPAATRDLLAGAMQEALDQAVPVASPAPRTATAPAAGEAITLEHALLAQAVHQAVASIPLGVEGRPVGAVTLARAGAPWTAEELEALLVPLAAVAPALVWMDRACRPLSRQLLDRVREPLGHTLQPGGQRRRRVLGVALAAFSLLALVPVDDTVGGAARIEGERQQVLAAPTDGFVKSALARPGERVKAGQAVLELMDGDLQLERDRWSSQLAQQENAYAAAMAQTDRVAAATSLARAAEAQAQLALVEEQLARGRIVAPFDALVIEGDLTQSIGAPVRQGDALLTLATTDRHRVIVEVDEVDIARVQPGQFGQLALSSAFWRREALRVERIAPIARAVDGRNVFEVEAALVSPGAALRPGLMGRASLDTGRAPWLWSTLRHALLRLRVTAWRWWGA